MRSATLSVVMSNYNHARFIPESLGAILAQSHQPAEILIIDDASTDRSVEVLNEVAATAPGLVRIIRNERNVGAVRNIRRLFEMSSGDYVFAASCDDRILPGFLQRSMSLLSRHPDAGLCSSLSAIMNEAGQYQGPAQHPIVRRSESLLEPHEVLKELRRQPSWFLPSTNVYRRAALLDEGGFHGELGPYCDGFISLVLALRYGACFIPEPLGMWRRMEGTYSSQMSKDIDGTVGMLDAAEQLMRTRYRDLFPADYIEQWRREMCFGAASAFVTKSNDPSFQGIERLMPRGVLDRVFLSMLRAWPGVVRSFAKSYLFMRLRRGHLREAITRKLSYMLDSRFSYHPR